MKKRLWSILLCFCMLVGMMPTMAMAAEGEYSDWNAGEDVFNRLPFEDFSEEEMLEYAVIPWRELGKDVQTYGLLRSDEPEARWKPTADAGWIEGLFSEAVSDSGVYDGGTIELLQDVYLTKTVTLSKDMTITSKDEKDPKSITCVINGHGYLLNIAGGTITLENVAVDGGYDEDASSKIYGQRALIAVNGGDLVIEDGVEIRNNYNATVQGAGGGVCVIDGKVTMNGGSIHNNFACSSGGVAILQEDSNVFTMTDGVVENNTAVTMYTDRTYTNGWKVQIRAGGFGGGFGVSAGMLEINGGIIQNNVAQPIDLYQTNTNVTPNETEWYACQGGFGGGIATYSSSDIKPVVEIKDGEIKGNDGFYGGGIYIDWGSVTVDDSSICSNTATSRIIREEGATGGYIEDKYGGHGGGVYLSYGSFTMDDCTVSHNKADYYGGGVFQLQGGINSSNKLSAATDLVIKNSSIVENEAEMCAGMYVSGSNKEEWDGTGGTWGVTKLVDTEITKNTAAKKGGGILVAPYQDVIVSGSVKIHNNTAPDHKNFLLDNDVEYDFDPGRVVVEDELAEDAVIYVDVCEHTTPYENVHQLVAVGTATYFITQTDFEKFESDNELYVTFFDDDQNVYLVPPDHTVTFDSRGGSKVAPIGVRNGDIINKPADPTREDYSFKGWYLSVDGGETLADTAYDFNTPVTESFTLYAKWEPAVLEPKEYTVTYDLVGGTGADGVDYTPKTVSEGETIIVNAAPTREGYIFQGYYDGKTSEFFQPGDIITVNEDIKLTALWDIVETEDPDDGEEPDDNDDKDKPSGPSYGKVTLTKVDAQDDDTVLSGVEFELYHENGTLIGEYATDKDGQIVVRRLRPGEYYWVEVSPAVGYILDDTEHSFRIRKNRHTEITLENERSGVPSVFTDDHYAYIVGYDDGMIHPEWNITRAEVAAIFFRLLDEETREMHLARENNFSDVQESDWFNTSVSTMAAMGIISGYPDGTFQPGANITRAEFAAIAARFDASGNTTASSFVDMYGHWAMKEINIASNNGWVLGYEDGNFRPDQRITRAEAMAMVNRVLQRIPQYPSDLLYGMKMWVDNADTTKWYYLTVQEATNSHDYGRKASGYEFWTELREAPNWNAYL